MNWDRLVYGKAFTRRKFHNEDERENWKKGFRLGFLVTFKIIAISTIVPIAAVIGMHFAIAAIVSVVAVIR